MRTRRHRWLSKSCSESSTSWRAPESISFPSSSPVRHRARARSSISQWSSRRRRIEAHRFDRNRSRCSSTRRGEIRSSTRRMRGRRMANPHRTFLGGVRGVLREIFAPHSHDAADSRRRRAGGQRDGHPGGQDQPGRAGRHRGAAAAVVVVTGSVALLADTIHNFSDALTAVPLWIAFALGRRRGDPPLHLRLRPRRGPRRAVRGRDDRAVGGPGRLRGDPPADRPAPVEHLGWVAAAGADRVRRQRAGRAATASGSAAGSARPRWSPTGCTPAPTASPRWPCCVGAVGVRSGFPLADPIVGLLITVAILAVLRTAARDSTAG